MKKFSYNFNIKCQVTLSTLISCFRTFVIFHNTRRNRRKSFLHRKYCLILQNFLFSETSWVLKKWSYNFNINCQVTLWNLISCSLTLFMFYNTRGNRRKSFLHWKVCLFLQNFLFSATSWVQKKWSYNFNINCQVTLWTLLSCSLTLVMFYNTRGNRRKSFLHWKDCVFLQKFMFSATSWVLKKWSFNFNINCHFTLWTLISCSLTFVVFYNTRRKGRKSFLHRKYCLILQSFMFSETSWVQKKWSYNFNINCQVTLWTLINCFRTFFMFYNTRRNRRKAFLYWKVCLFLQTFMFSATSWVQKKWSYNFNINCQVTLWNLISCSLMFVRFCNTRRNRRKSFLHWKDCLFLQTFMFSATSCFLKKWSFNFNINCQVTLSTLLSCFWTFVKFCNTRRNRRKSFLHWKDCLFLQNFMFSATSWVQKKWSYNFNINCQVTLWNLISCSLMFVKFCNTRRNRRKSFLHWKDCLFLQKIMFSANSWVLKKWSFKFNINCHFILWTLISCFRKFVMYFNTRRSRPKSFHLKDCLFLQKFIFSATSWVMKIFSYNFNINCQVTLWNLISCSLTFIMFYKTRRNRRKSFLHVKGCLFLQKFMFSATSWVQKKWSYNFNINCQVTLWNLISCSLMFVRFCNTRRNRRKYFLHWKDCLFLQKFMFSANSRVLKKWSFKFNIDCHFILWTRISCFRKFVMFCNTRWSRPKSFHLKDCLFLQKFIFSATSWVMKIFSYNFNINCQVTLWNLISCSLTFVMFYNMRRNRRKSFLHGKGCLFLQKFMFSATSWFLKKWSFNFNINCQVTLSTLISCFRTFVMFYNTRRKRRKSFLHRKYFLILQSFMFSETSWVLKKWSYNFNINCQVTFWNLISCSLTFVMF